MLKKRQGIILNTIDYKENHKILYLLTKDGKDSFLVMRAKRIKEGLANDTQNLTLIDFEVEEKNTLSKAKNIDVVNYFNEIKNDLKKFAVASYALELIYRMVPDTDTHSEVLYRLLLEFLHQVSLRNDLKFLLLQFRIKMLYFLGIQPQFKMCCHCGKTVDLVGISIAHGAMECVNHTSSDNIGLTATKIINLLYFDKSFEIKLSEDEAIKIVSDIIDSYYEKHQYYGLKSKVMLEKLGCY